MAIIELIQDHTSIPDLPDYVVDALWTHTELLHSWDLMADLALDAHHHYQFNDSGMLHFFLSILTRMQKRLYL